MLVMMLAGVSTQTSIVGEFLWDFANYGIVINVALAIFNMIPIPPLDGSHVVAQMLPARIREQYRAIGAYGIFILLIIFNFVPGFRAVFQSMIWGVVDIYTSLASIVM
jgi:Zn-dependent protease